MMLKDKMEGEVRKVVDKKSRLGSGEEKAGVGR